MPLNQAWSAQRALEQLSPVLWRYMNDSAALVRGAGIGAAGGPLSASDLTRLLAAHVAVREETAAALNTIRHLLRVMPATIGRQMETTAGVIRGRVDWQRTSVARLATADPTLFVCERTDRRYDTALGRLVKAAVQVLAGFGARSGLARPNARPEIGAQDTRRWSLADRVWRVTGDAETLLRHPKMRQVREVRGPVSHVAETVRRYPAAAALADLIDLDARLATRDPLLLEEMLIAQVFTPPTEPQIFELQVGVELLTAFEQLGFSLNEPGALLPSAGVPLATLARGADTARIWWQQPVWSVRGVAAQDGLWRKVLTDNSMTASSLIPDFVVECSSPARLMIVEAKLTVLTDKTYERDGLRDVLAYLNDLDASADPRVHAQALVVAWNATGVPTAATHRVLVVDQESVVETVKACFA